MTRGLMALMAQKARNRAYAVGVQSSDILVTKTKLELI